MKDRFQLVRIELKKQADECNKFRDTYLWIDAALN